MDDLNITLHTEENTRQYLIEAALVHLKSLRDNCEAAIDRLNSAKTEALTVMCVPNARFTAYGADVDASIHRIEERTRVLKAVRIAIREEATPDVH